jgi:hypothetical protein
MGITTMKAKDVVLGILVTLLLVAAFAIVGTCDYEDAQREAALMEEAGMPMGVWRG